MPGVRERCDATKREDKTVSFTVLADAEEIAVFYARPTMRGTQLFQVPQTPRARLLSVIGIRMFRWRFSGFFGSLHHDPPCPKQLLYHPSLML